MSAPGEVQPLGQAPGLPADPAGLGLAAFGTTTVLISLVDAGILPAPGAAVVIPLAVTFGGLMQLLVGGVEFRRGDVFGATTACCYGAFWLWWALERLFERLGVIDAFASRTTLGAALLLWAALTFGFWIGSLRLRRTVCVIFATLCINDALLGAAQLTAKPELTRLGGWVGLACGGLALYTSGAIVINATLGQAVLPVGERRRPAQRC